MNTHGGNGEMASYFANKDMMRELAHDYIMSGEVGMPHPEQIRNAKDQKSADALKQQFGWLTANKVFWRTKDNRCLRIDEMSARHILNSWLMMMRNAAYYKENYILYLTSLPVPDSDAAQDCFDAEIRALENTEPADFLKRQPLYQALKAELIKRIKEYEPDVIKRSLYDIYGFRIVSEIKDMRSLSQVAADTLDSDLHAEDRPKEPSSPVDRPHCYSPNNDPYPLCVGDKNDDILCKQCCLYENMENDGGHTND